MEEAMEYLEDELYLILASNATKDNDTDQYGTPSSTKHTIRTRPSLTQPTNGQGWTVSLQPTRTGIQLQTSITNIGDLVQFLDQTFGCLSNSPQRSPNYYSNNSSQTMKVTIRMLQVEYTLRKVFETSSSSMQQHSNINSLITTNNNKLYFKDHTQKVAILHLIDGYFNCVRSLVPIVASYYHPLISKQPNSTLAYALAGFMALSVCIIHVNEKDLPCNRSDFGLYLYESAQEKLRDDLFDSDDDGSTIETALALLTMAQSSMILLRNNDTRLYLHLAWQIVIALRDQYMGILRHYQQYPMTSCTTPPDLAQAETWRRLFYGVRYLSIHVRIIQENNVELGSILSDTNVGYPRPLLCELEDLRRNRMVDVYNLFVQLDDCYISNNVETIGYQLFAGVLDKASLSDISYMEHRFFFFWQSLPRDFRLTNSPMEYLDPTIVYTCQNNHILHLNQFYYSQWLTLEIRFMQSPATAHLQGTTLTRLDDGRALLIVSICADALTHIFQVLYHCEPCMLELHWLLITTDALRMLTLTANDSVRLRAAYNLRICLPILWTQMQPKNGIPSSTSLAACPISPSSSTSSLPTASASSTSSSPPSLSSIKTEPPHAHSPSNSSTSTGTDEEYDETDKWNHHSQELQSDLDHSGAYYGEIKKNLTPYFMGKTV
ncbi:hypothetical protein BC941DRAFT_434438 [Chlamydoabsidia padenii]|nr:hypothetical protein BC941DRAFT_434438 [Chlamydoabsidia padenii]